MKSILLVKKHLELVEMMFGLVNAGFSLPEWQKMILLVHLTRASDISRKKSKISRDFQGQIRGKIGRFHGKKVKIRRKIVRLRGILAEKSQISKDFQGQILRKIGRFHGKFQGGNFAKKQSVKNS